MGAQICSEGHDAEITLDMLRPALAASLAEAGDDDQTRMRSSSSSSPERRESPRMRGEPHGCDGGGHRSVSPTFDSTALIPDLFDVKEPGMQDPPSTYLAVHRLTGMVRRLVTVRKPSSVEQQERLRSVVREYRALKSEGVARILEVFEDSWVFSIVTEHCSGGTVYDRILQRQYFSEQESALLVKHMLQSLAALHGRRLAHGHLTPDSFRFQSEQTHAHLKLVDFGLDLKLHVWNALGALRRDTAPRSVCLQFNEICRLVFCAPEVLRLIHPQADRQPPDCRREPASDAAPEQIRSLDCDLLAEAIAAHQEQNEDLGRQGTLEEADMWSLGAIAFLLLCGYPPFFAPCRGAIVLRIEKIDFAFDPPFWSKISEEAKDFVQRCLRRSPSRRMPVLEALQHPWIQNLADTSPSGAMLSSFALNLRRFYRTSLIEAFTASSLAARIGFEDLLQLQARCAQADGARNGFLTATDLRHVLVSMGQREVAEAIGLCFARSLRHPGESYIDYAALADAVRARRERQLEDDLWSRFRDFGNGAGDGDAAAGVAATAACLPLRLLEDFLYDAEVLQMLRRDGLTDITALVEDVQQLASSQSEAGGGAAVAEETAASQEAARASVDFIEFAAEVIQHLPSLPSSGVATADCR